MTDTTTSRGTILIVDDDEDVREALSDALTASNYRVTLAGNGREALAVLANLPHPGLILLDLMMPVMNGQEFLAVARADAVLANIPVIIVSAYDEALAPTSAHGFLRKPISLADLLGAAAQYCNPATA